MKTSTITKCTFLKEWSNKFGTFYTHALELENGDAGQINTKDMNPEKISEGKEISYELTQPNPKYAPKIKLVNPEFVKPTEGTIKYELEARVTKLEERLDKMAKMIKPILEQNEPPL